MRGRARVIAINTSVRLAPWADVLYACDGAWWRHCNGMPDFAGLRVTQDPSVPPAFPGVRRVVLDEGNDIATEPGHVGSGANGGFQALNLALQFARFEPRAVLMLGFDMRGTHWHGPHPEGLNNPSVDLFDQWIAAFRNAAPQIARLGCRVINATPPAIDCFDWMDLETALASVSGRERKYA